MFEKWKSILTVGLLSAFVLGFGIWAAVKPADALSTSERRPLAQMPELSASSYLSGKFMSGYEDYATDQFPLREQFRTLKALMGLYVFDQKDNNGVYLADGSAAKLEYPLNEGSVAHAADRFRYLYETLMAGTNAKVYLSVIPDKNYFLAEANGYPALDYQALTDALRKQTEFAAYIDLFGTLTADDYYRTDSHWRQENLLTTAGTLAAAMGVALPGNCYTEWTLDRPYYGVYYGYAALPMEPDRLTYLTSDLQDRAHIRSGKRCWQGPLRAVPLRVRVAADHRKSQCGYRPGAGDLPGLLRQLSGPSAGPRLCQGDAGGHPLPSQQPDGKVPDLHRSGCAVPLQRPGAEQQ